jgi:hypothetical protein
VPRLP